METLEELNREVFRGEKGYMLEMLGREMFEVVK